MFLSVAPNNMRIEGPEGLQKNAVNVFKCHVASGNPSPKFYWTVEDKEGKRREEGETLNLATKELSMEKEVLIKCHAENSEGELTESRIVPVHHLPSFVTISSAADSESGKLITVEGSLVSAHCTAAPSNPKPTLVWRIEDGISGEQIVNGIQIKEDERGVSGSLSYQMPLNKISLSLIMQEFLRTNSSTLIKNLFD